MSKVTRKKIKKHNKRKYERMTIIIVNKCIFKVGIESRYENTQIHQMLLTPRVQLGMVISIKSRQYLRCQIRLMLFKCYLSIKCGKYLRP